MKKVFVFSDTHWSLGRIHRGIAKQLKDTHEFRYIDWAKWSPEEFIEYFNWCDKCITNLVTYKLIKSVFPGLLYSGKFIFVSHGYPEHENIEYDLNVTHGLLS